ncbi:MAG: right-handed parallel beta-helix repeat-containing protein [Anaerolineales bacterium]|nr:right-handed parallel beta-helix repeat-containing protein [Anaerolineales bacterium]
MTCEKLPSKMGVVVLIPFLILSCNLLTDTFRPEAITATSISIPHTPTLTPETPSPSPLPPTAKPIEELPSPYPSGNIYYVSPNGDDSNPGNETRPWQTIQKAAGTLVAGETVYIRAGTYRERVIVQNSGSADEFITFASFPGEVVTIDGQGVEVPEYSGLFEVSNRSYIKISELRIINSKNNGILADTSNHISIEKNYTYNTVSSGIGVWNSTDIIIDGNEVELACNDGSQEDITVAGTDTFEVRNNYIHHGGPGTNGGEGIDVKDGSSNGKVYKNLVFDLNRVGIYVDAWNKHTYNIEVYDNVVHDIAAYGFVLASEAGGLLENVLVYNNISYHNKFSGLGISDCCADLAPHHPIKHIQIINNTFHNNGWEDWGPGISLENPEAEDILVRNNIASQNAYTQIGANPHILNLVVDHNLIYGSVSDDEYPDSGLNGDPLFVNPAEGDFHLLADSPAIDQGSSESVPSNDFDGNFRPQDGDMNGIAGYDIGAFEMPD